MDISSVTEKGQATIPIGIRKRLGLKKGDKVVFDVEKNGKVVVKKAQPLDRRHLTIVEQCLAEEWLSDEDEEAFKDL